jgi:hypothetical protein
MKDRPMADLPRPTRDASRIADVSVAIAADVLGVMFGVPFGAVLDLIKQLKEKRIRDAQEILLEQLSTGEIVASDEAVEEFIPMAYHFYRAAVEGETRRVLLTLARIMKHGLGREASEPHIFSMAATALEGLQDRELSLLSSYVEITNRVLAGSDADFPQVSHRPFAIQPLVEQQMVGGSFPDEWPMSASCNLLSGRGLLLALNSTFGSTGLTAFMASQLAFDIAAHAGSLDE